MAWLLSPEASAGQMEGVWVPFSLGLLLGPPESRQQPPFYVTCYGEKGSEYHRLCSGLHGVSGTVHWAAPQGGICPPDPPLSHLVWSLLDSAARLQAPQTLEGRPGFPLGWRGTDTPPFSLTGTTGKRQQAYRGDTQYGPPHTHWVDYAEATCPRSTSLVQGPSCGVPGNLQHTYRKGG